MFGLSDNDNKKEDAPATVAPDAPPAGPSSDLTADNTLSQPTFPPPLPTIPPAVPGAPADTSTNKPATGLEAVPAPAAEPVDTAPMNAEDTMPELTGLDNADMPGDYIDEGPKVKKRKKPTHKSDDAAAHAAPMAGGTPHEDQLLQLKQQALQSLAPLVDKLDQSPEEKFKTTMMLIQASDNADLVQEAYAAANAIEDEKTRAQALLDVVNEINYFTQHNDTGAQHEEG